MKKYVLYALATSFAVGVSLFAVFKSPTTDDGVPVNPDLDFSFRQMTPQDQNTTGMNKLTTLEKAALEKWVSQWESAVAEEDKDADKDPVDLSALPTPPPVPTVPKNFGTNQPNPQPQQQQTAQNYRQQPQQQTTQNYQQQPQQTAQNNQQQPQQQTVQNDQQQPQQQQPVAGAATANSTVQDTLEEGKYLVVDNGLTYKIPTPLRKKTSNWKQGDLLRVEDTKKAGWIRITNLISGEFVLCKIETNPPQKQQ
jgi:outer membrane biosynthesis protein TonB